MMRERETGGLLSPVTGLLIAYQEIKWAAKRSVRKSLVSWHPIQCSIHQTFPPPETQKKAGVFFFFWENTAEIVLALPCSSAAHEAFQAITKSNIRNGIS